MRAKFLKSLSDDEAEWMLGHWPFWARNDQLPPAGDWSTWLILGGRGAGKTRAGAEWVCGLAARSPARIALAGETYDAARSVMVEGPSGILACARRNARPVFRPSRRQILWPGGACAELFSSEEPEALRGPQFHFAWCDELAKWRRPEETWNMLQFALRLGARPRQCVTTTPRPIPLLKRLLADPDCALARAPTYANRANLSPAFFRSIIRRYEGTRLGRQELEAELIEDVPGALWTRALIEKNRVRKTPPLRRTVIAVDPPATGSRNSDECGIIAAGLGEDSLAYILEDCSAARLSPVQWARRAAAAYRRHQAARLVAEVNQGGDMVEAVLRQIAPAIAFRPVRAARSKRIRAEPVAALYERGCVRHLGALPRLEDQMCAFTGNRAGSSPDRLDALVWAVADLLLGGNAAAARLRRL